MKYKIKWAGKALSFKTISDRFEVDAKNGMSALEESEFKILAVLSRGGKPYAITKIDITDRRGGCDLSIGQILEWIAKVNKKGRVDDDLATG